MEVTCPIFIFPRLGEFRASGALSLVAFAELSRYSRAINQVKLYHKGATMKKLFAVIILTLAAGCASTPQIGGTPEAQIVKGAQAHTAATTLATVLLRRDAITAGQAKGFSGLLHAASDALNSANATLLACRKSTGSTQDTSPDPCWPGVVDLIGLALNGIAGVQKALESK